MLDVDARLKRVQTKIVELLNSALSDAGMDDYAETVLQERAGPADEQNDDVDEKDGSITALKQEVEALRKMIAAVSRERDAVQRVSDLNLERLELQDELIAHMTTEKTGVDMDSTSEIPGVNEKTDLQTLDDRVELDRRFFVPKHR